MKYLAILFAGISTFCASAQIITPAYVISNSHIGVKEVREEVRTAYKDFRLASVTSYNKQGFPVERRDIDVEGIQTLVHFKYAINEDDSTLIVTCNINEEGKEPASITFNYRYDNGSLWEWVPVEGNQPVTFYKQYIYDENWNLTQMNEVKLVGADSSVVKRHRYFAHTDVFERLISTNHTEYDMSTNYNYDEDGKLLSKSIFDGAVKRSTEERFYNEDGLVELTVANLNHGGGLLGINRYSYKTYRKGKRSIFETWKPVKHPESVMQER